jgi:hypothetical protein
VVKVIRKNRRIFDGFKLINECSTKNPYYVELVESGQLNSLFIMVLVVA